MECGLCTDEAVISGLCERCYDAEMKYLIDAAEIYETEESDE